MRDNSAGSEVDLPALVRNWESLLATCTVNFGTPTAQLFGADSQRWSFMVWTSAAGAVLRPIIQRPIGWIGFILPASPAVPLVLDYRQLGALIGEAWEANFAGGAIISGISSSWKRV